MGKLSKAERVRRVLYGDLCHVLRYRYGCEVLTKDDAGLEDLMMLLELVSLGSDPRPKMEAAIVKWAPWMPAHEAELWINRLLAMPWRERKRSNYSIGKILGLTNAERERLKVWSIMPCDLDARELEDQRKKKAREREQRRRAKTGARLRQEYLAKSLSKLKPWEREGIGRATWYRQRETSPCETNIFTSEHGPVSPAPSGAAASGPAGGSGDVDKPDLPHPHPTPQEAKPSSCSHGPVSREPDSCPHALASKLLIGSEHWRADARRVELFMARVHMQNTCRTASGHS